MSNEEFIRVVPAAGARSAPTYAGAADQAWQQLEHGTYAATNAAGEDLRLVVRPDASTAGPWPAGINPRDYLGPQAMKIAERDGWKGEEWEAYATARAARESGVRAITIYTSDDCQACRMTKRAMDKLGVSYDLINIADVPAAVLEDMRDKGHARLPVVDTGQEKWSGFRPEKIQGIQQPERG